MADVDRERILSLLERVGHQEDGEIDLADTALLLGAVDAPATDLAPARRHLEQLRNDIIELGRGALEAEEALAALRAVIYEKHGYHGDSDTYDDPRNANLLHVIDRKKGLPVALGILCVHTAAGAGWDMKGLNFPSHFLLRLEMPSERAIVDPFDACANLDAAAIRSRLKEMMGGNAEFNPLYFEPVSNRQILLRLQNNIKLRALQQQDFDRGAEILNAMILVAPQEGALISERAVLFAQRGELRAAIDTLSRFLDRGEAAAEDHPDMIALLRNLRGNLN